MTDEAGSAEQLQQQIADLRRELAECKSALRQRDHQQRGLALGSDRPTVPAYRHIPLIIWQADAKGNAYGFNDDWYEYTGQSHEETQGRGWLKAIHPDDVEPVRERMRAATANRTVYKGEYRVRRALDGSYRWHLALGRPMKDSSGNILYWYGSLTDIDDQKQVEEELRENQAILSAMIECIPFDFFAIGSDGRYTFQNRVSLAHWGNLIGKSPTDVASNDTNLAIWTENNERAFAGEKVEGEVILTCRGERRSFFNILAPIREEGDIRGILGMNIDITDRKQAEEALKRAHDELEARVAERTTELASVNEALRRSRDELRAVYDGMVNGLALVDIETQRLLQTNAAMCRMLGRSAAEVLALSVPDLHPLEHRAETLKKFFQHVDGSVAQHRDVPVIRKDGSSFFVDVYSSHIVYSGRPCLLAVFCDVTEHRRSRDALMASEEKYRRLVEASPDAVIVICLQGTIRYASSRLLELFGGEDISEFLGRSPLEYIVPEEHEKYRIEIQRLLEDGTASNIEYRFTREDGTHFPGEVSAALIRDTSGKPAAMVAVLRDITERKRIYDALEQERRTLKHLLQSSDHERQVIAYEIHDGLAQLLAAAIMQFQSPALIGSLSQEAANAYQAGITMLRQSHFEARRLISGVRPPILDEEGVVAAVTHLINEQRYHKGPQIEFVSEVTFDRLTPILENAVYRIIQEGLLNACNHSKSENVAIELAERDSGLQITIQDWGVGFNPHATETDRFGLDGIRERARLLGGVTSVESHPGQGTRITVELPVLLKE